MDHPSESESVASPPPDTPYSFSNKVFEQFSNNSNTTTISAISMPPIVAFHKSPNEQREDTASVVTMQQAIDEQRRNAQAGRGERRSRKGVCLHSPNKVRKWAFNAVLVLIWFTLLCIMVHYAIKTAVRDATQARHLNVTDEGQQMAQTQTEQLLTNGTEESNQKSLASTTMKPEYADGIQRVFAQGLRLNDTLNKPLNLSNTTLSECRDQLQQFWSRSQMVHQQISLHGQIYNLEMKALADPRQLSMQQLQVENATVQERLQAKDKELAHKDWLLRECQVGLTGAYMDLQLQYNHVANQLLNFDAPGWANATVQARLQAQEAELKRKEDRIRQLEFQTEEQTLWLKLANHTYNAMSEQLAAMKGEVQEKDVQMGKLQGELEVNQRELNQSISAIGNLEGKVKECHSMRGPIPAPNPGSAAR